jgi:AraC-like DNA-binding protein
MDIEILRSHRFQFIKIVSFLAGMHLDKSKANFNDHSNLIHITNGKGKVFFGSEAYPLSKGVVIALPAFVGCHFEYEAGIEMLNIHYNIWNKGGEILDDLKRLPLVFKPDYFGCCEEILKKIQKMKMLPSPDDLRIELMAHEVVLKHFASNPLLPSDSCQKDERISIINKRLKSSGCIEYDAKKMAKSCFLSVSQMNRKFKFYFKESPRRFWEKNRYNKVCHALLDSNKPLAEIASDFAFSYQSHFSKWFKNIAKISPAEYRRKFSGETDFRP